MQTISDKDFDKLFRGKFDSFEEEPSPLVWENIANELKAKKKKTFPMLWVAAASIVLAVGAGLWFLPEKEPIKLYGKVHNEIETLPGKEERSNTSVYAIPHNENTSSLNEKTSSYKTNATKSIKNVAAVEESKKIEGVSEKLKETHDEPAPLLSMKPAEQAPVVIELDPGIESGLKISNTNVPLAINGELSDTSQLKHKQKIKTVGDLVNFVVSRVDKRKNKIIEFSKEDEGDIVSGLNLGLLQYKTKDN